MSKRDLIIEKQYLHRQWFQIFSTKILYFYLNPIINLLDILFNNLIITISSNFYVFIFYWSKAPENEQRMNIFFIFFLANHNIIAVDQLENLVSKLVIAIQLLNCIDEWLVVMFLLLAGLAISFLFAVCLLAEYVFEYFWVKQR